MRAGQRVAIADGVLQGKKATVTPSPENGKHEDGEFVWIKFDCDNARLGKEMGYAILSQQWYEVKRLRPI